MPDKHEGPKVEVEDGEIRMVSPESDTQEDGIQVQESEEDYNPRKFDLQRQAVFLEEFAKTCNMTVACECAGVCRKTVQKARDESERFEEYFQQAKAMAVDSLAHAAMKRARDGVVKRKRYNDEGNLVGETYDYSDSLTKFLLKNWGDDRFNEKDETELSGELTIKVEPQSESGTHNE
jgi:hypothetical protein